METPIEKLIARLGESVRRAGENEWSARCPAHDDRKASLSIGTGDDGKILLTCHAGCERKAIVAKMGLEWSDLFPEGNGSSKNGRASIVATYPYHDASGTLIYEVVRFDPKGFRVRSPNGKGGVVWKYKGERVLYRLPQILAAGTATPIYFPEGEKCVGTLERYGLTATCTSGGAANWHLTPLHHLHGRGVILIPDNDGVGHGRADCIGRALHGRADVRILTLPNSREHGDATDWLADPRNGGIEQFLRLAEAAPAFEPRPMETPTTHVGDTRIATATLTDLWLAERLVREHGDDLRYCPGIGWLNWTGRVWEPDATGEVYRLAKRCIRDLQQWALKHVADPDDRRAILNFATRRENLSRLNGVVGLAQTEAPIVCTVDQLDADPWALNCNNGVLDLRHGTLRPHDRADLCTKLAPVDFHTDADCPQFRAFLERIFAGDAAMIGHVRRTLGYALTGVIRDHVLIVMYGTGANGKTTLVNVVLRLLGDYGMMAAPKLLISRRHDAHPTELADLRGRRFVACAESGEGQRLDEERVKLLTGGEVVRGRYMRADFFEFAPTHKLAIATNHKPAVRGTDLGIWRRLTLWPFNVTIPPEEQDPTLTDGLVTEGPGILAWAVGGCLEWQRVGLAAPQAVTTATDAYRAESDVLGAFLGERCIVAANAIVGASELYAAYKGWAETGGEYVLTQTAFGRAMAERGITKEDGRSFGRRTIYRGVRLVCEKADTLTRLP